MSEDAKAGYFALFDFAPSFDLDIADLEKRYFNLQRTFHPDRLTGKPTAERARAIAMSMRLNEAYEALKSTLPRARHLLALEGIEVGGEQDTVKPSAALLMEVLESREALAEAQTLADVEEIQAQTAQAQADVLAQLSAMFATRQFQKAAALTLRLGYLQKLDDEIRIRNKFFRTP